MRASGSGRELHGADDVAAAARGIDDRQDQADVVLNVFEAALLSFTFAEVDPDEPVDPRVHYEVDVADLKQILDVARDR